MLESRHEHILRDLTPESEFMQYNLCDPDSLPPDILNQVDAVMQADWAVEVAADTRRELYEL